MIKKFLIISLFCSTTFLTGCLGEVISIMCDFFPDGDHCYQAGAVQESDPTGCEKIKGEGFKGSNPPKDKCYLQIAENTGDLEMCKKIEGGPMSYTPEECFQSVAVNFENPLACKMLQGSQQSACLKDLGIKITADKIIDIDEQIKILKEELLNSPDKNLEDQMAGLEARRTAMLGIMTETNKNEYDRLSDPTNQLILGDYAVGDIDKTTKDKLIALNETLKAKGESLPKDQYEAIRDYLAFVNDPKNNIENMDDSEIVKDRWNEKMGNVFEKVKFWKSSPSETEARLDEQLRFYERMLERQAAIEQQMSEREQDFERNIDIIASGLAGRGKDIARDKIIETLLGTAAEKAAGITTDVLEEAIDVVKEEAKSKEFRGLVRAYNLGMEEELKKFGGDVNKAHEEVVKNLYENPYNYEDQNTFAKYGNILENKECDGTNPHCINKDVFWKSMKKSYNYQNQ